MITPKKHLKGSQMKQVILSHDSEAMLYLVPDEIADNLDRYCWDFAADWVWNGPEKERFLHKLKDGNFGVVFGAPDFIDYLNAYLFPDRPSVLLRGLGCYDY